MWRRMGNRIIRQGDNFWSSLQFDPTPEEIGTIVSMAGDGEFFVCRAYKNMLIFRDNEFVGSGPFFAPEKDYPPFATDRDIEFIYWMKRLGEFSTSDLAKKRYPEIWSRGEVYKSRSTDVWADNESQLDHDDVELYDYRRIARSRTTHFLHNKAKNEGWVEQVSYGKWKYRDSG